MSFTQNEILMEIAPRLISLGGAAQVHRLMPYAKKRMVGPFIFFDYFPATDFKPGEGMEVRPHPHIGLSTLSYLLEGEVLHHDSLGNKQILSPGDVNWMTAGRGIAHSERTPEHLRNKPHRLHLMQFWVALPLSDEEVAPQFTHHPEATIPRFQVGAAQVALIAGEAFGKKSPVEAFSKMFFMDVRMSKGDVFKFDPEDQELAFYIIKGSLKLNTHFIEPDDFVVLQKDSSLEAVAAEDCHFVVLGGKAFDEPRNIFWNFVSSSKERIEQAKNEWRDGNFPQVPGEPDTIPLPAPV